MWKKRFDDGKKCKDATIEIGGGNGEKKELKPPKDVESVRPLPAASRAKACTTVEPVCSAYA